MIHFWHQRKCTFPCHHFMCCLASNQLIANGPVNCTSKFCSVVLEQNWICATTPFVIGSFFNLWQASLGAMHASAIANSAENWRSNHCKIFKTCGLFVQLFAKHLPNKICEKMCKFVPPPQLQMKLINEQPVSTQSGKCICSNAHVAAF